MMDVLRVRMGLVLVGVGAAMALGLAGCACGGGGDEEPAANESKDEGESKKKGAKASSKDKGLKAVQIGVHNESSFALMSDGTVRAWGSNAYGQLGSGKIDRDWATPVAVKGIDDAEALFVGGGNLDGTACVRLEGGKFKCWGGAAMMPGVNKNTVKPTTVSAFKGAKALSLGAGHGCLVDQGGAVKCWGSGAFGVLGQGNKDELKEPGAVEGIDDAVDVRAGMNHTCALHESGEVSCWGNNFDGQSDPETMGYGKDVLSPRKVKGIDDAKALAVGNNVSCVLRKDEDGVWCWGDNFREKKPFKVPESDDAVAMSGNFGGHTCFIDKEGSAWCWGENNFGQAGVKPGKKTRDLNGTPQKVRSIGDVEAIAAAHTSNHTCALVRSGKVMCWGRNRFGAVGDGTLVDRSKPKTVKGLLEAELPEPADGFDTVKSRGKATKLPDDLPEGCKGGGKLKVKLEFDGGVEGFAPLHASAVRSPRKGSDKKAKPGTRYEVSLRNYTFDPKLSVFDFDQRPRGQQFALSLAFTRDKAKEVKDGKKTKTVKTPLEVNTGDYTLGFASGEDRQETSVRGYVRRQTVFFGRGFGKSYKGIELTHVGDDWICGTIDLKNDKNRLKGHFVAPVKVKK